MNIAIMLYDAYNCWLQFSSSHSLSHSTSPALLCISILLCVSFLSITVFIFFIVHQWGIHTYNWHNFPFGGPIHASIFDFHLFTLNEKEEEEEKRKLRQIESKRRTIKIRKLPAFVGFCIIFFFRGINKQQKNVFEYRLTNFLLFLFFLSITSTDE